MGKRVKPERLLFYLNVVKVILHDWLTKYFEFAMIFHNLYSRNICQTWELRNTNYLCMQDYLEIPLNSRTLLITKTFFKRNLGYWPVGGRSRCRCCWGLRCEVVLRRKSICSSRSPNAATGEPADSFFPPTFGRCGRSTSTCRRSSPARNFGPKLKSKQSIQNLKFAVQ